MPCYWQIEDWDDNKAKWVGFSGNYPDFDDPYGRTDEAYERVAIGIYFDALPEDATIQLTAIPNGDNAKLYAPRTVQLSWTLG